MVNRDQLIGQKQVDVLMIGRAVLGQVDLFEMKRDVIAKRPIKPEPFVALVPEQIAQCANN